MAGARRWPLNLAAIVLDPELLVLHLAVHAGAGLQNLTLLRLVELHLVIRQETAAGAFAWEDFVAAAERAGSLGYAWPALRLCEDLVPGTVPDFVLERCARQTRPAVRRVVSGLTPATAQRIGSAPADEHYMWTRGWGGRLRQTAADVLPARSLRGLWAIYEGRAWRLIRR